jgi:hypothetical protein
MLLQHGRQRIIYGVSLVDNLLGYLLGVDAKPRYKFRRRSAGNDVDIIAGWWMRRWLSQRIKSADVLNAVKQHRLARPVRHGARVTLPPPDFTASDSDQLPLY